MQSEQDDLEEEDDFDSMGMAALQGGSGLGSAENQSGGEAGRVETKDQVDVQMSEHFSGLFDPLKFPPELSRRILTHTSHPDSVRGHNRGFYFIGMDHSNLTLGFKLMNLQIHRSSCAQGVYDACPQHQPQSKRKARS